nr:T9SS type A sorting domain-containing protein [uncultured Psychroserpens sp.]
MKKIIQLLIILTVSFNYAQVFPIDFSEPEDAMNCFDCAFALTTDNGNDVGSITGGGLDYDTAQLNLVQNLDLSDDNNNTITFRIKPIEDYGTRVHLLKFEGIPGTETQLSFTTTGTDWQNITLDYGPGLGSYSLLVFFPDFESAAIGTYLVDDFAGGTNIAPVPELDTPSPTPSTPDNEVLSIYGDTGGFTNIWVSDYSFGEATIVDTNPGAAINNTLKIDFSIAGYGEGTEPGTITDVSAYNYFHFDYWSSDATQIRMILIEEDGAVQEYFYELPTQQSIVFNEWTGVDIPLTFFTNQGFSLDKFFQYKLGTLSDLDTGIVYFDNLYFSVNPATNLSVKDFNLNQVTVYPNPTNNVWKVITQNQNMSSIYIFDVLGKNVLSMHPNSNEVNIDASNLNEGLYFATINTQNGSETIKLIKK